MPVCRICHKHDNGQLFVAREMMQETKEEFEYYECHECGSVLISEIPHDLERFYKNNYWRFATIEKMEDGIIRGAINRKRSSYWLYEQPNKLGWLLALGYKKPRLLNWLKLDGIDFNSRILDVGSGPGEFVVKIANTGFRNVHGLDPFIEGDVRYGKNVVVYKNDLEHFEGEYDYIMLNHSFEHMPDPRKVLAEIYRLLSPNGWVMIRIPLAATYAWRHYRENWVQLDPPRHLCLLSAKSMVDLAGEAGFSVEEIRYDSEPLQFWGSEQYKKDISLFADDSYELNPEKSMFTTAEIDEFRRRAHELNAVGDGDQAAFFLRRMG